MLSALFIGGSAAFFTAYVLAANALGVIGDSEISPITPPGADNPERNAPFGFILDFADGVIDAFQVAFNLAGQFFQLLTFQAPGQEAASLITAIIFVPLGFVNGIIIFRLIRGGG